MSLFSWFKKEKPVEERSMFGDYLLYNSASTYANNKAMLLSAVYRCTEVISDSVAQLPLEPYRIDSDGCKIKFTSHPTYNLLNREPNKNMSKFTFLKTMVDIGLLQASGLMKRRRQSSQPGLRNMSGRFPKKAKRAGRLKLMPRSLRLS